jgi:hypothetical protein
MSRQDRVAQFRRQAGGGWYDTSLRRAGEHRPSDGSAVRNWFLREPIVRPTCFGCRNSFTTERRPAAFLTVTASRSPRAGIAVSGLCQACWAKLSTAEIEAAALDVLRRQLNPRGRWIDGGQP